MSGAILSPLSTSQFTFLPFSGRGRSLPTRRWRKCKVSEEVVTTEGAVGTEGGVGTDKAVRTGQRELQLTPIPYPMDSLEPYISLQTMEHQWRDQKKYFESLKLQKSEENFEVKSLASMVVASYNRDRPLPTFNNMAQIWNHKFFWRSMKPGGGELPSGDLLGLIKRDFGSFKLMVLEFRKAARTQYGSGWIWLAYKSINRFKVPNAVNPYPSEEDEKLVVVKTPNAMNPLVWNYIPLLGIDLWEHAYYYDYEDRVDDYVSNILEKLVSWSIVGSRLRLSWGKEKFLSHDEKAMMKEKEMVYTHFRPRDEKATMKAKKMIFTHSQPRDKKAMMKKKAMTHTHFQPRNEKAMMKKNEMIYTHFKPHDEKTVMKEEEMIHTHSQPRDEKAMVKKKEITDTDSQSRDEKAMMMMKKKEMTDTDSQPRDEAIKKKKEMTDTHSQPRDEKAVMKKKKKKMMKEMTDTHSQPRDEKAMMEKKEMIYTHFQAHDEKATRKKELIYTHFKP